jgi:hypothetical protein
MVIDSVSHSLLMLIAGGTASLLLAAGSACAAPRAQADLVEFEKMTWVEVKTALAAGKTTALIYTGGVEQRGPQNANGGHNLIAHAVVEAIARKLGNAIYLPVLPTLRTMQNRFPVPSGSRTSCSLPCSSASRSKRPSTVSAT